MLVTVYGDTVELSLDMPIHPDEQVYVDYTDPTADFDDPNAIQSLSDGTDAESLINEYVTNNSEHEDTPADGSDSHGYHPYITITPNSETNPGRARHELETIMLLRH